MQTEMHVFVEPMRMLLSQWLRRCAVSMELSRASANRDPILRGVLFGCLLGTVGPAFYLKESSMSTSSGHTSAIRASKVVGTKVEDTSGQKIGKVEDVILDKQANAILFAVVSFGGFLGMGEKYHPLPWASLDYDESRNSYIVNFTKEQLQAAPVGSVEELTRNDGMDFRDRTYAYYKADRYWE
jgi:sporulation protein YlmC with PRC-barrel domain